MKFPPLIQCDSPGCVVRVEPHVKRCHPCEGQRGPHPEATGKRGCAHKPSTTSPGSRRAPGKRFKRDQSDNRRSDTR